MNTIPDIISAQNIFFKTQKTKDISSRLAYLNALKSEIIFNEQTIYNALNLDFKKSEFESFISEFGIVISTLNLTINNLKRWTKPERVKSSLLTFPSKDFIYKDPYGTILIIAPWNYPFLLAIEPLIMAFAAGNTVVLKPSELTKNTSQLIADIIKKVFPKDYITVIQGGIEISTELLAEKWDYIFFTGSVSIGKIVAQAAAKHLTPVTLELGGKSPCIIDDSVNLKLTARRIVWGKFLNGGQTCIAPDYIIIKSNIKSEFIEVLKNEIVKAYSDNPINSPDFPRIINKKNTIRLANMLKNVNVVFGGTVNKNSCYISPTIIDEPSLASEVMSEEIFGPILPILSYNTEKNIENIILNYEKPLSLYVFSNNKIFVSNILEKYSFGNGTINDVLVQFGNHRLPFGGIGNSGMGAYHGKLGFDTFLHKKGVIKRGNWFDPNLRYAPYNSKLNILKKIFKLFS